MASKITGYPPHLSTFRRPLLFDHSDGRRRYSIRTPPLLPHSSRRLSNLPKEGDSLIGDPLNWSRSRSGFVNGGYIFGGEDDDDEDEEEEEEERSLDLLFKFVQTVFKKISRKARKAVRSVLPVPISSKLVGFSVNGVIILTFMWVLKAFLEVICTLGSVVFISILLIRGIWNGISYLQENSNHRIDELDDEHRTWSDAQPAT